jgi:hypothetical protein
MALKSILLALGGAALIASTAQAADYAPDEYLSLDLSKAVLSPKRLGPTQQFEAVPVEAKAEPSGVVAHSNPRKVEVERVASAPVRTDEKVAAHRRSRTAELRTEARNERRDDARARLAHHHRNPLNAEARDTRIQKWPCSPDQGGICAWRQ